jgi:release factor glutamine methyltransferase
MNLKKHVNNHQRTITKKENPYIESTLNQLKESQKYKKPYLTHVSKKEFAIYPNVFSPKYFSDTAFFAQSIVVRKGEKFLEMGCGAGIIAVFCALNGAIVTAIDINKSAVENTNENIKKHGVSKNARVLLGDLYSPLRKNEKFDTIFWNVPFIYTEKEKFTDLEKSVFNPRYDLIRKFVNQGKKRLRMDGRILIGFSKNIGRLDVLKKIIKDESLTMKEVAKKIIDTGSPLGKISLEIYEIR